MGTKVRSPKVKLFYAGTEITGDVSGSLISFGFTDQGYDRADSISVTLENREQLWNNGWMPAIGGIMAAVIYYEGDGLPIPLICGVFTVDDMGFSAPPDTVRIQGVSASVTTALRNEKNSKSWENTSIEKVSQDIAGKHGLAPYWDADDVEVKRIDQRQQSDLSFLRDLLNKFGIKIKVSDGKLVCRGIKQMDAQPPTVFIHRGSSDVIDFNLNHKAHNIFKAAQVSYVDPEDRENKKHIYIPPDPELVPTVGNTLKINERVESVDQAEKRAEGELREKNKDQTEGSINLIGNPIIYAGMTALLTGFGLKFDGLWLIREAQHTVSRADGYKTDISIRKTLGW